MAQMQEVEAQLAEGANDKLVRRYGALEDQFAALGGYAAEAEAARICANLGLPDRALAQTIGTLSGGQRRRIELARILFRDAGENGGGILLLDEPTNHLDADSITWLRGFLANHKGGLIVISHDGALLESVVNKVWFLDATRSVVDVYNLGWKAYLEARETDERRRRRERANAEKKAGALMAQADKMRAKATKTVAAQNMARRAEKLISGLEEVRVVRQGGQGALPEPRAVRQDAADRDRPVQVVRLAGDLHRRQRGGRPGFPGGHPRASTAPARPPCCGCSAACSSRTPARCTPGTACGWATTPRSTRRWTWTGRCWSTCAAAAVEQSDTDLRKILGAFLFSGDDVDKPAGVLSGGEKTRLALATLVCSGANVLLLDEPTNNLDPVSREQVLDAIARYPGAIVLVTHDPGAVLALKPDRAILLPDGDEDAWSDDLLELVELA